MERVARRGVLLGCLISSGLALACASPPDASSSLDEETSSKRDAGRGRDAGRDAGKTDARAAEATASCTTVEAAGQDLSVAPCACEDDGDDACVQICRSGKPSGACKTVDAHAADLTDSEVEQDAGYTRPDSGASVDPPVSAGAGSCPATFTCSNEGGLAVIAQGAGSTGMCAVSRGMPLACSTLAECSKAGLAASCYDLAANGFPGIAGMLGLPDKFCAAPCNL